jgi:hypothetical protein
MCTKKVQSSEVLFLRLHATPSRKALYRVVSCRCWYSGMQCRVDMQTPTFGATEYLLSALKMEAVCSSETLVSTYKSVLLDNSEEQQCQLAVPWRPQISCSQLFWLRLPMQQYPVWTCIWLVRNLQVITRFCVYGWKITIITYPVPERNDYYVTM